MGTHGEAALGAGKVAESECWSWKLSLSQELSAPKFVLELESMGKEQKSIGKSKNMV